MDLQTLYQSNYRLLKIAQIKRSPIQHFRMDTTLRSPLTLQTHLYISPRNPSWNSDYPNEWYLVAIDDENQIAKVISFRLGNEHGDFCSSGPMEIINQDLALKINRNLHRLIANQ